jgi:hypothetical protein
MKLVLFLFICSAIQCPAQLKKLAKSAKDVADAAELAAITVDIIESASFTLDKIKTCQSEIKQLESLVNDAKIRKYMPNGRHRLWADQIKGVSMNVKMYAILVSSSLRRLTTLKGGLIAKNATKLIESAGELVSGNSGNASEPVVQAIDEVEVGVQKASLEQTLVSFLLKLDTFNRDVDELVATVNGLSESLGAELALAVLMSIPNTTIIDYASRKNLNTNY